MSLSNNFPNTRPSLLLDFANTKALDPRVTFTRASTATYYDGKTVAKAEENLLTYSQEFDLAWAGNGVSITANTTTAPDGTSTAETITESATTGVHRIYRGITGMSGQTVTFSIYAKANGRQFITLNCGDGAGYAAFDLSGGTVTASSGITSSSIVNVGNGWYRCIITDAAVADVVVTISNTGTPSVDSYGSPFYTGDGTSGIYIWGAQLAQADNALGYVATTSAPAPTVYQPKLLTAAAGVARFDHNPTTGESLGLLIEEQRTNLLTYSEQFDNAYWVKTSASITANADTAPDGTTTADKLIANTTNTGHYLYSGKTAISNSTGYTFSVYAKDAGQRYLQIASDTNSFPANNVCVFDLQSGTVVGQVGFTGSITSVGGGWYRCVATATSTGTDAAGMYIAASNSISTTRAPSFAGDGYSGIYIWGAQLEAGAFPTSYIKTEASQVTRSADAASMTGTNFSSWYRQDEGTMYADFASGGWGRVWSLEPIAVGSYLVLTNDTSVITADYYSQGINAAVSGSLRKAAVSIGLGPLAISGNGGTVTSTTSSDYKGLTTTLNIGSRSASQQVNGTIKKIAYYPVRLSNANLQALTS